MEQTTAGLPRRRPPLPGRAKGPAPPRDDLMGNLRAIAARGNHAEVHFRDGRFIIYEIKRKISASAPAGAG